MAAPLPQTSACFGEAFQSFAAQPNAAGTWDVEKDGGETCADTAGGEGCCSSSSSPAFLLSSHINCCFKNLPAEAGGKGSLAAVV